MLYNLRMTDLLPNKEYFIEPITYPDYKLDDYKYEVEAYSTESFITTQTSPGNSGGYVVKTTWEDWLKLVTFIGVLVLLGMVAWAQNQPPLPPAKAPCARERVATYRGDGSIVCLPKNH